MSVWIPHWLVNVGGVVGIILAWEAVKSVWRWLLELEDKMGW